MKKTLSILLIIICSLSVTDIKGQNPLWTDGTAFTIPKNKLEINLFRPTKFGLTKKDELSAHPVGLFILPHFFYKRRWIKFTLFERNFMFSSRHGIYYPNLALKLNNRLPFNSTHTVPEEARIPHALAFQSEAILSHFFKEPSHCSSGDYLVTGRLGFKYALKFNSYDHPFIHQSVLYRESAVLQPGFIWFVGADLNGHLNHFLNYFADLDFYSYGFINDWSIESKLGVMGYSGEHLSGFAGLKLGYSTIPDRNRFLVMPIAGVSYTISVMKRKNHGLNLFKKLPFKHDNSLERDDEYYENLEKREKLKDTIQ